MICDEAILRRFGLKNINIDLITDEVLDVQQLVPPSLFLTRERALF
jgi:hypothetical protein